MKNTLGDLNNHLFAQLERLSDEDLDEHKLEVELRRSKGICEIARNVIDNANVVLQAAKLKSGLAEEHLEQTPKMLEG